MACSRVNFAFTFHFFSGGIFKRMVLFGFAAYNLLSQGHLRENIKAKLLKNNVARRLFMRVFVHALADLCNVS
jgi:hypothetical protein